jgi:hypothetical protein
VARVNASTKRKLRNVGSEEAVYVCVGGAGGYVGRDGVLPEGEDPQRRAMPSSEASDSAG